MADKKISQLTAATTPLAGTEVLPVVQSGATVKVSAANITAGRAVSTLSVSSNGPNGIPISLQEITAAPSSATAAYVGVTTSAFPGGANGDLVLIPRTSAANDVRIYAGSGTPVEALVVQGSTSNVRVQAGNLVVGTAGKGIDFSANTHAAGMTSELLDWYEEGTWTPVVKDAAAGNAATAASSSGYYTRVGRLVHFTIRLINIDTTGLTAGNQIHITGLPFAVSGTTGSSAFFAEAVDISSTAGSLYAHVDGGTTYFVMFNGTTTGQSNAIVSQITSGSGQLFINGTYVTA